LISLRQHPGGQSRLRARTAADLGRNRIAGLAVREVPERSFCTG
jgi:hypothetical protein